MEGNCLCLIRSPTPGFAWRERGKLQQTHSRYQPPGLNPEPSEWEAGCEQNKMFVVTEE